MSLDLYFFNFINQFAGRWQWLDWVVIFFAEYFGYFLLFCFIWFLLKDFKKYWRIVTETLTAAVLVRFVLAELIRVFWFQPRPFVSHQVNLLLPNYNPNESSFPSGHASFYFTLSTVIYCYSKKAGILFYLVSFLISFARVFAGVHWPSDIVAGAFFGIIMGLVLSKLFKKIIIKKPSVIE